VLDEKTHRKPAFDEANSAPVVLADGQTWYLPKPWLEVRPVFRGGRAVDAYPTCSYGPVLDELIEAVAECEDPIPRIVAVASLAAYLLKLQYELSDTELDRLLAFRGADERSTDWLRAVFAIAVGQSGPKVSSAGGD
jgi:hypothetical protein